MEPIIVAPQTGVVQLMSPSTATNNSGIDESNTTQVSGDSIKERCKERFDAYKRQIKRDMPLSDQLAMRDT